MKELVKPFVIISFTFAMVLLFCPSKANAAITNLTPLAEYLGDGIDKNFAYRLAIGDVNGDGLSDVIISKGLSFTTIGKVYIFYGEAVMQNKDASQADIVFTGEGSGDFFGDTLKVEDLNNDGYDDIIVGAYGYNGYQGKLYVFYGSSSLISKNASEAEASILGEAGVNGFGISFNSGDLNDDAFQDIIIGASYYPGGNANGRIYVLYGDNSPIGHLDFSGLDNADVVITGEVASDFLGISLSSGDVNGDSCDDLVIGAYWNDRGIANGGSVYIFYGSASGMVSPQLASSADAIISCSDTTGASFGYAIDAMGDINNDGIFDLLVGAKDNDIDGLNAGRSYVFLGGSFLPSQDASTADAIYSGEVSSYLGQEVYIMGDVNNDGFDDIIMSANGASSNRGRAYIVFGSSSLSSKLITEADVIITGENSTDYLVHLDTVGDVNGDGWKDFLVGTHDYPSNADTGKSYLYSLDYASPQLKVNSINDLTTTEISVTGTASVSGVNVGGVEMRLDGGEWMTCNAADGAFDEPEEEFICPLSGLSSGEHTVEVRFYDENMIYIPSSMYASETFNVALPRTGQGIMVVVIVGLLVLALISILKSKSFRMVKLLASS